MAERMTLQCVSPKRARVGDPCSREFSDWEAGMWNDGLTTSRIPYFNHPTDSAWASVRPSWLTRRHRLTPTDTD